MPDETKTSVAIACQGGGSHTAFTAGVLRGIIERCPDRYDVRALSGTSGGAMCAALAWDGLRRGDPRGATDRLDGFWEAIAADSAWDRLVNTWTVWGGRFAGEVGSFGVSPYLSPQSETAQRRLRRTIDRFIRFEDAAPTAPPHLFVGAVDAESGSFEVFVDGEEGARSLLASAAIPNLFQAVEIGGTGHWDGLFSQNPPIRHFTSEVPAEQKPDEIWIVRVNSVATGVTPRSMGEIADRRNELGGNLSLEQEKYMIDAINDLVDEGVINDDRYKHIKLREVELGENLDLQSKLDRSPAFLEDLMARGERKASEFWV